MALLNRDDIAWVQATTECVQAQLRAELTKEVEAMLRPMVHGIVNKVLADFKVRADAYLTPHRIGQLNLHVEVSNATDNA